MVIGGAHEDERDKPKALSPEIAVFPLAMPMVATPQGLVAITVIVAARRSVVDVLIVVVVLPAGP